MSLTSSAIRIVGIDYGTQNCTLAVSGNRGVDVLVTETGDRHVPSTIAYTDECRSVGDPSASTSRPMYSVLNAKRLLGLPYGCAAWNRESAFLSAVSRKAADGTTELKMRAAGEELWLQIEQVVMPLFRRLRTVAEYATQQELKSYLPIPDAVVSVPCFYTETQRERLVTAALIGDVNILCTINDTTAAALDYGLFKTSNFGSSDIAHVVLVSMGHSCSTCALVKFTCGKAEVISQAFDEALGGRDFDYLLFQMYAAKISEKYRMDVLSNQKAKQRLLAACNRLKVLLSPGVDQSLSIECLMNDTDVAFPPISRNDFADLCSPLLHRVEAMVKRLMRVEPLPQIDSVEVFGGTTRIPCVQDVLAASFGCPLSRTLSTDTVARGCSIMGAMLNPNKRVPYSIVDHCVHDISYALSMELSPIFEVPAAPWPAAIPQLRDPSPFILLYDESTFWKDHITDPSHRIIAQWSMMASDEVRYTVEVLSNGRLGLVCHLLEQSEEGPGSVSTTVVLAEERCGIVPDEILQSWSDLEQRLRAIDAEVIAVAETRNAIESMIYDVRPQLQGQSTQAFYQQLTAVEKGTLLDALQRAEDWLYGDADQATLQEIQGKLNELRGLFDKIVGPYERELHQQQLRAQAEVLQQHIMEQIKGLRNFVESPAGQAILSEKECEDASNYAENITQKWTTLPQTLTDATLNELTNLLDQIEGYSSSLHYKKAKKLRTEEAATSNGEPLALPPTTSLSHAERYEAICSQRKVKCNSALYKLLESGYPSVIDLSKNFVGPKGAMAVVELVGGMPSVTELNLSGNSLDNEDIQYIARELKDHPSLTSLDLSDNPISVLAGQQLLRLVNCNPRITKLNLDGTLVMKAQKENLARLVAKNAGL